MARMVMLIAVGIAILIGFQIIGIPIAGFQEAASVYNLLTGEISAGTFFNNLFDNTTGILLLIGVAATIVVGFVARAQLENVIVLPFITGTIMGLVSVFIGLLNYSESFSGTWAWLPNFMLFFMGIYTVIFVITAVEFFRGNV